ncbi:hypothetical protein [Piscinibacter gummiphilus]|uniref:Uncharacterized protein n=1 Tax=Piscinibacter gummiphilus TaxID=946333 RepID=A0ABZ0D1H0_9BURK|nr:hypothetical protein [Piscinibacter gummiphilus]WOB11107.1 hypothetical protein RXV79_27090 [Piscinibacter gummiphilus]
MNGDPVTTVLLGVLVLLAIGGIAVTRSIAKTLRTNRQAEWVKDGGKFEPASQAHVDELLEEAERRGKRSLALVQLATVRRLHGHAGVRIGHIVWILKVLDGDIDAAAAPPSFVPPAN